MRIDHSPLISHIAPETSVSTPGTPTDRQAEVQRSRLHEMHGNSQLLAGRASTSQTTTSKLDKVSEPKLQINKHASSPNGLYGVSYYISTPDPGLSNITFPIIIDEGAQRKSSKDGGIYYAMQFGVNDESGKKLGGGYIGMQPRGDGKALITFSGFGPHFSAPKGRDGADGGPGASNSTLVDFKFGHKYNLTVARDPDNPKRLKAYVQDVTDPDKLGPMQHVKDLDVDQKVALAGSNTGFVEHYGAKIDRSSQIATTSGSFFAPFSTDDKGNVKNGSVNGTGLYGRFANSMTGGQEITKRSGRRTQVKFSLQGVGYEKKT
ncbi:hypothetical protein PSH87_16150 [Pseudomonas sp. FP453]|jgi:hypothetical protein|uniref:hypothetical protein n=1 Tax=Pseudomonas sp. FP453 TaxID=2954094 RepID=UPI0027356635|nr:hypothetical protein [Pseudomonas sp. FP453]WLH88199.1 hypothetical protein PSH87_16150 [Pseudomonas sp. FP453]